MNTSTCYHQSAPIPEPRDSKKALTVSSKEINLYRDINAENFDQKRPKELEVLTKSLHFVIDKESRPV